jgi:hypothetical protein
MEYIISAILLGMAALCEWVLSDIYAADTESSIPIPDRQKEKLILLLFDFLFILATLVSSQIPVILRWSLWFSCWTITVFLVQIHFGRPRAVERKVCVMVVAIFLFFVSFQSLVTRQWMEERSLVTSGQLCVFQPWRGVCYSSPIPIIEIGDSGTSFIYIGKPKEVDFNKFAYNVGLRIERGPNGIEVTTPIRDKFGQIIAKIEKNRWTVLPPAIWNYTESALEVKDRRDQVVFQIRFLSDRVQIQAEWRDEFGHGMRWAKCPVAIKSAAGCVAFWGDARTEQQNEQIIEPIFQYPANEHWGEFVKKQSDEPSR